MSSPVIGFDLGANSTTLAIVRARGVDIAINEVSNRSTPTLVAFGSDAHRCLGEPAKSRMGAQWKNTITFVKHLIGRKYDEPEVTEILSKCPWSHKKMADGTVGALVDWNGSQQTYSMVQILAMFLTKMKSTGDEWAKVVIRDATCSVPSYFNQHQRKAVIDAFQVAGMKCLQLINDTTAAGLAYGLFKTDLPDNGEPSRKVCFVDFGASSLTASVVAFTAGKLRVLSTVSDRKCGAHALDELLTNHFEKKFSADTGMDIGSNNKAMLRLNTAVEKMRKVLSANRSAPLAVESIMNDRDVKSSMTRDEFEALSAHLFENIMEPVRLAVEAAKIKMEDLFAVECVGGAHRTPLFLSELEKLTGKNAGKTLNAEEFAARGAGLMCAILSPSVRVRPFRVEDASMFPVEMKWPAVDSEELVSKVVFPANNKVPCKKAISFKRKGPFSITCAYSATAVLPEGVDRDLATWKINLPVSEEEQSVTVNVRLDSSSLLVAPQVTVKQAEEFEETKEVDLTPEELAAAKAEAEAADKAAGRTGKDVTVVSTTKKVTEKAIRTVQLPVAVEVTMHHEVSPATVSEWAECERALILVDNKALATEAAKNDLESYINESRDHILDRYAEFVTEERAAEVDAICEEKDDWLYDEGEDATMEVYKKEKETLVALMEPFRSLWKDDEDFPKACATLKAAVVAVKMLAGDSDHSHIAAEELAKVEAAAQAELDYIVKVEAERASMKKTEAAVNTFAVIQAHIAPFQALVKPILDTPKPEPVVDEAAPAEEAATEEAAEATEEAAEATEEAAETTEEPKAE